MNVSIIGASGYSGAELIKILLKHPPRHDSRTSLLTPALENESTKCTGCSVGQTDLVFERYSAGQVADADLVFIALPSGEAMHVVPELLKAKKRVIDLGGDYRLKDVKAYQKYYQREHVSAESLCAHRHTACRNGTMTQIKNARLVANPGCYATSAILPIIPMVKENLVEETGIVISAVSGVSGAGRSSSLDYSFSEVNESVRAYKVSVHQHTPEIESAITENASHAVKVTFVPHLIPITRGIYSSIYLRLKKNVEHEEIFSLYKKYYSTAPFVRVHSTAIPEIKNVNYTNFCDIGFRIDERNKTSFFSV